MRNFMSLLRARWAKGFSVCVGLDSDADRIAISASEVGGVKNAVYQFNTAIIDATADLVCAYKPNIAFYSGLGLDPLAALRLTVQYIHAKYPEIPVIVDAKRGDIGKTNDLYLWELFQFCQADAVTVHPYLGQIAMQPFLNQRDKGIFVLCKTSNPGAGEFQDLYVRGQVEENQPGNSGMGEIPLYLHVAMQVASKWNSNGNCGLVAGATYPDDLWNIRLRVGNGFPLLIPGIGTQGGDLEKTVLAAADENDEGMIINSSSGIIFASSGPDFADVARRRTMELHDEINRILRERSAV